MTETAQEFIERKTREFAKETGQERRFKDIGRRGWHVWRREAFTFMPQGNYAEKVFVIERFGYVGLEGDTSFKRERGCLHEYRIEYRIGYFIVGKIGRRSRKWTWGQYCPLIPADDFHRLIEKAEKEGTILRNSETSSIASPR